jgi:excinuclease UvrABC nuclease subunit
MYNSEWVDTLPYKYLKEYKDIPKCPGIYIFRLEDEYIYIGKSDSIGSRVESHVRTKKIIKNELTLEKMKIFWFKIYGREVFKVEKILIKTLKPYKNKQGFGITSCIPKRNQRKFRSRD